MPSAADHPENAGLRRYRELAHQGSEIPSFALPHQVVRPYDRLGTHPDLVARLWDELPVLLPADCRAVFFGAPALVHPETGIVFGFAGGTHTYALRLPEPVRSAAIAAGATMVAHGSGGTWTFDLKEIGAAWVFGFWSRDEPGWCLAAFEFAGRDETPTFRYGFDDSTAA